MTTLPSEFPISLRSWPSTNGNDELPSIISRINTERGGFRNVTEESLRQEIIEEELNNENDNPSSSEDEEEPDRAKDLNAAREAFVKDLEQAHQSAMLILDFVSLLLSKDIPVQASLTLSQDLQSMVGTQTLGMGKLAASRITEAQKQDYKNIAKGWKTQFLDKAVDSVLASATRLEKEIEHETKYWEQVLAVSERGWAVCRLPNQKHILGVRFGFSESSPAFRSRSLAALTRKPDGSISLDQGLADAEPKSLRVRIKVDGKVTGSSTAPKAIPKDSPVEALILQSRNTIFAEELWQELNRESRTMEPVKSKDNTLVYELTAEKFMVLDLVPLEEESTEYPGPDGPLAQSLFFAFNILLCYAHRQAHRARSRVPPPISSERRITPPLNLFRPFIARAKHQERTAQMHALFRSLYHVLVSASLPHLPSYTLVPTVWPAPLSLPIAERTILALTERLEVIATFTVTPTTTIKVKAQTYSQPTIYTQYLLALSPADSPLQMTCPAVPRTESFLVLQEYIYYATSCALASIFVPHPFSTLSPSQPQQGESNTPLWTQTAHPNILKKSITSSSAAGAKQKQLAISIRSSSPVGSKSKHTTTILRAQWEFLRSESSEDEDLGWMVTSWANALADGEDVSMAGGKVAKEKVVKKAMPGENSYSWIVKSFPDGGAGEVDDEDKEVVEVVKSLVDVVRDAGEWSE
ncbi:hypothetical protein LZ554_008965 [Drepanopeziza brunnea f. sp. 'monogermtubi']|nr:hypothetical protein LZ554_008965 [Drepanopeziza brunnea f. sp. 'monogermtubi']